jgi:hypothetical protein
MALVSQVVDKPVSGVGTEDTEFYAEVSALMERDVPAVLKAPADKEITIDGASKDEAERAAGYARAWGMRQDPKIELRRIAARQGQPATRVRLSAKLYDPNAPRPGRPAGSQNQPVTEAPATPAPAETPATPAPAEAPKDGKSK